MRRTAVISDQGLGFIRNGQMWMYRNNLVNDCSDIEDGETVDIRSEGGEYVATGFYSPYSHIAVRIISYDENQETDESFFRSRIRDAVKYRRIIVNEQFDNCRMVFAEADGLPGLIVDRYNDILVTQISCSGMEIRKDMVYRILLEEIPECHYIYERNDIDARKKEHLDVYKGFYGKKTSTQTVITENGIRINVDIENGQKTGYFLDQKSNRMLIQKMSEGLKVLDCFSHTGGFALNAAKGNAEKVTAVDVSRTALDQGYRNAVMNDLQGRMEFVQDDVFDYLDKIEKGQFDLIILDPPAFTKSRRTIDHAYNGYKEINRKAMEKLEGGSFLATCSCSRYMEIDNFEKMLMEAAKEAGVKLKQISVTQQNGDHPINWSMSETAYLKFYLLQIYR